MRHGQVLSIEGMAFARCGLDERHARLLNQILKGDVLPNL